jgi:hypothetical protein
MRMKNEHEVADEFEQHNVARPLLQQGRSRAR